MNSIRSLLDDEQREVWELVESLAPRLSTDASDPARAAETNRALLLETGIWSIGMPEVVGGSAAPFALRIAGLAALGATHPAAAWACAQAHAAVDVLVGSTASTEVAVDIAAGLRNVAVIEADAPDVALTFGPDHASGTVGRVDPAGSAPALIVLGPGDSAHYIDRTAVATTPLPTTGMHDATTVSAQVDGEAMLARGDHSAVRTELHRSAAAIAASLAARAAHLASGYAETRQQFGGALADIPTIRDSLGRQHALSRQAFLLASSDSSLPQDSAAIVKRSAEVAVEVSASAVQVHGGYGYLSEYEVERTLRDALSFRSATAHRNAY